MEFTNAKLSEGKEEQNDISHCLHSDLTVERASQTKERAGLL